jgi:hypothetical protein
MSTDLIAGTGDTLVVVDNRSGAIVLVDRGGSALHAFRLPETALDAVDAYLQQQRQSGRNITGSYYVRYVSFPDAGGVYVHLAGRPEGLVGLWLDLEDGSARPVEANGDDLQEARQTLWAAIATAIVGQDPYLLIALTAHGLFAFCLEDAE